MKKIIPFLLTGMILITLDLLTKNNFTKIINKGSVFGLISYNLFWIIFSLIAIIIIAIKINQFNNKIIPTILLSGIVGNFIDRIFFSGIRDCIQIWIFPIFNLADSYILISIILLIYFKLKNGNH